MVMNVYFMVCVRTHAPLTVVRETLNLNMMSLVMGRDLQSTVCVCEARFLAVNHHLDYKNISIKALHVVLHLHILMGKIFIDTFLLVYCCFYRFLDDV